MILKDIYFFEETNQIGDSKILINENKGDMLSLQVNCEGNFNFEVQGCIDIVSDTYNKVFATNMLTSERQENVTSNGIYQIDIDGYRRIKLVLNSIGSKPITVYGVMKEENGDIDIEDDIATKDYVNAAISGKEDASNKVTSIDNNSTDVQYPSAKAVYDLYQNAGQTLLIGNISNLTTSSTTQQIYDAFGSEEIFNSFLDYTKNSKPIYMYYSDEYGFDGRHTDTVPIIKTEYDKYPGQNNGQVRIIFPNMSANTKEIFTYYRMVIGFSSNVPSIVSIEKLNSLEAYIINPAIDSLASESTSSDISNVINLGEILKLTSGSDTNGDYILNMYSPVFKFSDNTYNPAVLYNIIGISVDNFAYGSSGYNFIIQYMKGSDKLVTLTLYSNSRGETDSYAFVSKTEITLGGDTTQYSTMPTANADTLGEIVQYIGVTTNNYVNGYFYKCVSDGAGTPNYSWENINVQASSSIVSIDYSSIYSLTESSTSEQIIAAFGGADKVDEIISAAKEGKLFLGTSEVPGTITTGIDTSMLVQVFYKEHDWSGDDTLTLYFIPSITSQYDYGESLTELNSLKIKKCRFDRNSDNGEMYCQEAREIGFIDSLYTISTEVNGLTTSSTSVEINAIINLPNIIGQETGAWAMQVSHKAYTFNAGELQSNYYFIGLGIQNLNPPFFNGDIRVKLSYIAPTNKLTTLVLNYNETSGLSSVISKSIIELDNLENSSNKVTSLSSSSTDTQYPSAKCVYDLVGNISTVLASLVTVGGGN